MKNNKIKNSNDVSARLSRVERYLSTHRGDIKARTASTAFTPTTTGTVSYVSAVAQDDTAAGRTGNQINALSITVGSLFKMTATCSVRVLVVRDTRNQGAIPAIGDILDGNDVISPLNYNNTVVQKRFIVVEDYVEHFSLNGVLSASRRKRHVFKHKISYSGASSSSSDALSNNIYVVVVTDTPTAGQINLYSRLEFTDE